MIATPMNTPGMGDVIPGVSEPCPQHTIAFTRKKKFLTLKDFLRRKIKNNKK